MGAEGLEKGEPWDAPHFFRRVPSPLPALTLPHIHHKKVHNRRKKQPIHGERPQGDAPHKGDKRLDGEPAEKEGEKQPGSEQRNIIHREEGPRLEEIVAGGRKHDRHRRHKRIFRGCIYVSANIEGPGALVQHGKILRVVFGVKEKGKFREELKEIAKDFNDSGISGELSENIRRDALEKFSYVSPIGAAGLYYHATAADFQREGEEREAFKAIIREIMVLAEAMGVPFERDYVKVNLEILSHLAPESTTSMQRDVMEGKQSEIDGLVYEVVRMGEKYHVPMPVYKKIADELKER